MALISRAVRRVFVSALDRRVTALVITRLRRNWPVLRLVPAACIRPVSAPAATLVRRELSRDAIALAAIAGIVVAAMTLAG
jgi:hypothetical protein